MSGLPRLNRVNAYFLPGELEAHIAAFVGHCNHQRYLENLKNRTLADVYTGRDHTILLERDKTKKEDNETKALAARQIGRLSEPR